MKNHTRTVFGELRNEFILHGCPCDQVLIVGEPEADLVPRRFSRVAAVAEVAPDVDAKVAAHCARQRLDRVGRAQQLAVWSVGSVGSGVGDSALVAAAVAVVAEAAAGGGVSARASSATYRPAAIALAPSKTMVMTGALCM